MTGRLRSHDTTATADPESGPAQHGPPGRALPAADCRPYVVAAVRRFASAQPDAPAVVGDDATLTYRQLYERAERMAAALAPLAPRADDVVALRLPRGAGQVTAALAVLLAGRPYLLIDTDQPKPRTAHILRDSGARAVITRDELRADVADTGVAVLLADRLATGTGPAAPAAGAAAGDLAYLCYTSGSSGPPKGVKVTHHGLANLVAWYIARHRVTPADRMTQLASASFDAWALEVWPCLAGGATLHVADPETVRRPDRLRDWLTERAVTVSFLPTPLAAELLDAPWPSGPDGAPALRALLVGGDRLTRPPARRPPFRLFNNYGPTEATVVATCAEVLDFGSSEPPPIGRPIPSVHAYVLRPDGRPAADGETGELHLGGPAVARGYTAAGDGNRAFLPDPHTAGPDATMYRTGDLVRRDADGDLHFVGRVDEQIKVNGVRVEPAEVEDALLRHPAVRSAAAVLHRSPDDAAHLVGYVVTDGPADARDLRRHVAAHLPAAMVPHLVVGLDALPLTPHGKLDRAALSRRPLPAPVGDAPAGDTGDTEDTLRGLWAEVLGAADIAGTDDFFDLGGDSLRALRFINKARRTGVLLVPDDLYTHSVLRDLARFVDDGPESEGNPRVD